MNATEAFEQLHKLLDDMDGMYSHAVSSIEEKLSLARTALERRRGLQENADEAQAKYESQKKELQGEIAIGQQRIRKLEEQIVLIESDLNGSREENQQILAALENSARQADELASAREALTAGITELDAMRQSRDALEQQLIDSQREMQDKNTLLETLGLKAEERDSLEARAYEVQQILDSRESELQGLKIQIDDAHQQLEKMGELQKKVEEQASLQACLVEREGLVEELKNRVSALEQETVRLLDLERISAEREESLKTLEQRLAEADEGSKHKDAALEALRMELSGSREELAAATDVYEKTCAEIESLRSEHQGQCVELASALTEQNALAAELDILRADHQAMTEEMEQLKAQLVESAGRMETLDAEKQLVDKQLQEVQELKESHDRAQSALQEKEGEIEHIKVALAGADEQRSNLELQTKMLLGQVEGLEYQQQELESLKDQVKRLENALSEERAQVVRLKALSAVPAKPAGSAAAPSKVHKEPTELTIDFEKVRKGHRRRMGEILLDSGVITEVQLEEVMRIKGKDPRRRIGGILNDLGYASEGVIAAALAAQLRMRYVESIANEIEPGARHFIPTHLVVHHKCVPLGMNAGILTLAMANPLDLIAIEDIEIASNARVEPVVTTSMEIDAAIKRFFQKDIVHSA